MFRRVGIVTALFMGDMATITLALVLASWIRPQLVFGRPIPPQDTWPSATVYVFVFAVWASVFLLADVYSLPKNLRATDEYQRLLVAHLMAVLAFAGALYFSFSRAKIEKEFLIELSGFRDFKERWPSG